MASGRTPRRLRDHALEVARYRDARDAAETPVPADEYAQAAGRTFDAKLDSALDAEASEARVRAILADFNARIIEARRQLTGGPPVTTRLRDVDAEPAAWRARAEARAAPVQLAGAPSTEPGPVPARRSRMARLFRRSRTARLFRRRRMTRLFRRR